MSNFSAYLEQEIVGWLKASTFATAPTSLLCALSKASPLDDASGISEPVSMGYTRKAVDLGTPSSVNGVGTTVSGPTSVVVFGPASGTWGSITHWALYDNTGTNMLFHGAVTASKNVVAGDSFVINIDSLTIVVR